MAFASPIRSGGGSAQSLSPEAQRDRAAGVPRLARENSTKNRTGPFRLHPMPHFRDDDRARRRIDPERATDRQADVIEHRPGHHVDPCPYAALRGVFGRESGRNRRLIELRRPAIDGVPVRPLHPVTAHAVELGAEHRLTPGAAHDPRTVHEGRPMAYVPAVTAIELRDPVAVLIEMKTGDRALHRESGRYGPTRQRHNPDSPFSTAWPAPARRRATGFRAGAGGFHQVAQVHGAGPSPAPSRCRSALQRPLPRGLDGGSAPVRACRAGCGRASRGRAADGEAEGLRGTPGAAAPPARRSARRSPPPPPR